MTPPAAAQLPVRDALPATDGLAAAPVRPVPVRRPRPAPGQTAQWAAVALFVLATNAFFAVLPGAEGSESQPLVQLIWIGVYLAAGAVVLDRAVRARRPTRVPWALVLLALVAGLSVLWSSDPSLTLRRSIGLAGTIVVGVVLARVLSPLDLLQALRRAMVIIGVASLLLFLSGSALALDDVHGTLRGVESTKNSLGRDMAIGLFACGFTVLLDRSSLRRCALSAVPMALALALTDSTAGFGVAALAAGGAVIVVLQRQAKGRLLIAGAGILTAGALLVVLPLISASTVAGLIGEDTTLTGRDTVWSESLAAGLERPLLGHGYGAFWTGTEAADGIRERLEWSVPHAHNGLLDTFLELGVVGVVAVLLVLLLLIGRGVADARDGHLDRALLRLPVAALVIVSNVVESGLVQQNSLLTVLLVAALAAGPHADARTRPPAPVALGR